MLDNSKRFINNCDISKVGNKVTEIKKMSPIDSDCINNEGYSDNYNNNYNSDRMSGEKQGLDDLKSPE